MYVEILNSGRSTFTIQEYTGSTTTLKHLSHCFCDELATAMGVCEILFGCEDFNTGPGMMKCWQYFLRASCLSKWLAHFACCVAGEFAGLPWRAAGSVCSTFDRFSTTLEVSKPS